MDNGWFNNSLWPGPGARSIVTKSFKTTRGHVSKGRTVHWPRGHPIDTHSISTQTNLLGTNASHIRELFLYPETKKKNDSVTNVTQMAFKPTPPMTNDNRNLLSVFGPFVTSVSRVVSLVTT